MKRLEKTGQGTLKRKLWRFIAKPIAVLICVGMIVPANVSLAAESEGSLENQILEAKTALSEAKRNQKAAEEKFDQGSLSFIDWMLARSELTDLQKYDLEQARQVITKACEENFSKWYGGGSTGLPDKRNNMVTCVRDYNDAISLTNLEASFSILRDVNVIREADENYVGKMHRKAAETNFYFMAVAQTGADRGAGLKKHSLLQVSCENLAFGASNPAYAWRSEIDAFNELKGRLGMTVLSKESDVDAIEELADSERKTVGHYTNLFWSVDQVMGAGYTSYGSTSCYNASNSSYYSSKFALYTIDEFEALFNEYYATVNPDVMQAMVDTAQERLQKLLEQQYENCTGHMFGDGVKTEATCKDAGGTLYTCVKCGYTKIENEIKALGHDFVEGVCTRCKITGPKEITYVNWRVGSTSDQTYNQSYEIGQDVEIRIAFKSASEYLTDDKFTFDIEDPAILSYEPATNSTGTMHINHIGKTVVTVYPAENPSLFKKYTISVTDVGGHDYVIKQADAGAGKTTKVCSKCSYTEEVTLPTAITKIIWWKNNSGTYSPSTYKAGDEVKLSVSYYSPADKVDNAEFVVEVSDTSIATVASAEGYAGVLTIVGNGKLTVTVYAKYDTSVKQEYTLHVGDEGENTGKTPEDSKLEMPKDDTDEMPEGSKVEMPKDDTDEMPEGSEVEMPKDDTDEMPEDSEMSDNTVKKGTIFSTGTYKYKIIGLSEAAFVGLTSSKLTTAKIPESVIINRKNFKVTSVADKAFLKSNVKSVTVGSNVKTIGSSAFKDCSRLRKITVGNSVTKIGNNAFENCSILKSVTIPIKVTSIGARAFSGCKKLSVINIKSLGLKSVGRNAFKRISSSAKIKVPSKKLSVYKKLLKSKGQEKNVKISE